VNGEGLARRKVNWKRPRRKDTCDEFPSPRAQRRKREKRRAKCDGGGGGPITDERTIARPIRYKERGDRTSGEKNQRKIERKRELEKNGVNEGGNARSPGAGLWQ